MSNNINKECYLCRITNALELPKLGPWDHIECPSCGKYKIHYDLISHLPGLDGMQKEEVIKKLKSIVMKNQDREVLKYGMIHFIIARN